MLESKTLLKTPVPDINLWGSSDKKRLIDLVDKRLTAEGREVDALEVEIDGFISDAYGLTANERRALGLEEYRSDHAPF